MAAAVGGSDNGDRGPPVRPPPPRFIHDGKRNCRLSLSDAIEALLLTKPLEPLVGGGGSCWLDEMAAISGLSRTRSLAAASSQPVDAAAAAAATAAAVAASLAVDFLVLPLCDVFVRLTATSWTGDSVTEFSELIAVLGIVAVAVVMV